MPTQRAGHGSEADVHSHFRALAATAVFALMILSPLSLLLPTASSDPGIVDNGNMTKSVFWNFTDPANYTLTNTVVSGGFGMLEYVNETVVENTSASYDLGTKNNTDSQIFPDSIVIQNASSPITSIVLQPGPEGIDGYLQEDWPNLNDNGTDFKLDGESTKQMRPVIQFDLSSIPAGAVIWNATMWLYMKANSKDPVLNFTVNALNVSFDEQQVCWNRYDQTHQWTNAGGDFSVQSFARGSFGVGQGWKSVDMSKLVDLWVSGRTANVGFIMIPETVLVDAAKIFVSSDETNKVEQRPRLAVNYSIPITTGSYESRALGPGTNATMTLASWSYSTASLATDEFAGAPLSSRWGWWNNPFMAGGNFGFGRAGWLTITGGTYTDLRDDIATCNYLYQNITGFFSASTSLQEYFVSNSMATGLLLLDENLDWLSIYRSGYGADGRILVVVTEDGSSRTLANISWADESTAFLRMDRTLAGIDTYASHDGSIWTPVFTYLPQFDFMSRIRLGVVIFSGPTLSNPIVDFDYIRIEPQGQATSLQMKMRTGNSTVLTNPSWTAWSGPLAPETGVMLGVTARYVQYQISMSTPADWMSPMFSGFTCHYERYVPSGTIVTEEYTPTDFQIWESMRVIQTAAANTVQYSYSTDHGSSWIPLGFATAYSLLVSEPSMIVRMDITNHDTLTTPTIDSIELVYRISLSNFYLTVPGTVTAGQFFSIGIEAKDSSNNTAIQFSGTVTLHATDAAGTGSASQELSQTLAIVPLGGIVTVSNERYDFAETIRILVTGGGISGLSDPITVGAGPAASIVITPNTTTMVEFSSQDFSAAAFDAYGNQIPNPAFTWAAEASLGSLNTTTGSDIRLTVGAYFTGGYLNVSADSITESRFIEVSPILYAPVIDPSLPDQVKPEDFGEWTLNITDYVSDTEDSVSELRWYTTHEMLVKVKGENRTGNMLITFQTMADLNGVNIINLVVVDSDGLTATKQMLVEITPVNDGPTIGTIDPIVVHYDDPYLYNFLYYIHDVDNSTSELKLTVDTASKPYATVDRLTIVFRYPESMVDTTQTVIVTVSDGLLSSVTAVVVKVSSDGVPKMIEGMDDIVLNQGETKFIEDLTHYFYDPDGDVLYYVTGNVHVMVEILDNHTVNVTAPDDWYGVEFVIFQAIDPFGARAEIAISVTVIQVNKPPVIRGVPDLMVRYDERYDFDLEPYIHDPDESVEELDLSVDDVHAYFMGTTISMLYPFSMNGQRVTVNITVSDRDFSSTWMINVSIGSNHPPVAIAALPEHSFQEDLEVRYPFSVGLETYFDDNEDGNALTFTVFSDSEKVNVTAVMDPGTLSWHVDFDTWQDWYGDTEFTVRARDKDGGIAERTVLLEVTSVPDSPVLQLEPEIVVVEGEESVLNMKPFVTDPDSFIDSGDFTFQVRLSGTVTDANRHYIDNIQVLPGMLLFNFDKGFTGSSKEKKFTIEVRVIDQDGKIASDTMTVIVRKAPGTENTLLQVALLITGATALGLFMVAARMRKKPFIIRDMMLIHNDGFLIGRYAGHSHIEGEIDQDILSGMLTAVLNFVEDSMSTSQDQLKTFGFKEYHVLVKRGVKSFAAIVYDGDVPDNIDSSLSDFIATFERIYKKKVASWTGDIENDFAAVEVLIQSFVMEHSKRHGGKAKKMWVSKGEVGKGSGK